VKSLSDEGTGDVLAAEGERIPTLLEDDHIPTLAEDEYASDTGQIGADRAPGGKADARRKRG
jgi:hypothetical protein